MRVAALSPQHPSRSVIRVVPASESPQHPSRILGTPPFSPAPTHKREKRLLSGDIAPQAQGIWIPSTTLLQSWEGTCCRGSPPGSPHWRHLLTFDTASCLPMPNASSAAPHTLFEQSIVDSPNHPRSAAAGVAGNRCLAWPGRSSSNSGGNSSQLQPELQRLAILPWQNGKIAAKR
jgi:hypothetical protein